MSFTTQLPAAQEYVYVIHAIGTNRIKLGFSTKPKERLAQLQTGSPFPLQMLACWPGSRAREKRLHRYMSQFRQIGEWFEVPPFCGMKVWEIATQGIVTGEFELPSALVAQEKEKRPSVEACKGSAGTWNIRLRWNHRPKRPVSYCCTLSDAEYNRLRKTRWQAYKEEIIEKYASHVAA